MFKMMAGIVFPIFTLLVLFQAGGAAGDTNKSPPACYCSPVINIGNNQLLQAVNDLRKEVAAIKDQISKLQPGMNWVEVALN